MWVMLACGVLGEVSYSAHGGCHIGGSRRPEVVCDVGAVVGVEAVPHAGMARVCSRFQSRFAGPGRVLLFFLWEDSHFLIQVFDANGNIKHRGEELNNEAKKTVDTESKSVELGNTQAPGGDEENLTESKMLGRSSAPDRANCANFTDAEEELLRLERSRKLIRKTESGDGDGFYTGSSQRLQGLFNLAQDMKDIATLFIGSSRRREDLFKLEQSMKETAAVHTNNTAEGKPELATTVAEDKNPLQTRSRKLLTQVTAGRGVYQRKRQAKGLKSTPMDDEEGPETCAKARYNAKVSSHEGKAVEELGAEACPPLNPRPEEAAKSAFKRPKPIILPKLTHISKRRRGTLQEQDAALATSHEYAKKSINNKFVMQMRTLHVYCGLDLMVPSGFAEAMLLPPARTKVTLLDMTGKTWEVEWIPRQGLDRAGWTRFVMDHCLDEGDVCVFELPDPKVFNISMQIFKAVP